MTVERRDSVIEKVKEDVTPWLQAAFDDVRGRELNPDIILNARQTEIEKYEREGSVDTNFKSCSRCRRMESGQDLDRREHGRR